MNPRLALVGILLLSGCEIRSAEFVKFDEGFRLKDAGPGIDAFVIEDAAVGDDAIYRVVNDGGSFIYADAGACASNLQTDPANCGECGNVCSFNNALSFCAAGECKMQECLPGWSNLDNLPGCEYQCTLTKNGVEACDAIDNDCDGTTDDETRLDSDVDNCGSCGLKCSFLNGGSACVERNCVLGTCADGWKNANNNPADGCECAVSNSAVEICDGMDNDCNGTVDDVPDIQNSTDPQNCGACNRNCTTLANASGSCVAGSCSIVACSFGFSDANTMVADGCELACPGGFAGAAEVCDNVDNDCDGKTDAADDSLQGVVNFCRDRGECAGAAPACENGGWICSYKSTVETTAPNLVIGNESRCDGLDNDCDGCVDESFPQVGLSPANNGGSCVATTATACADDQQGQCRGTGRFVCNGTQNGVRCAVDLPGKPPGVELCDNVDNNCDGVTDNANPADAERVKDAMVAIGGGNIGATVYIDAYEASRPDATAILPGVVGRRACSKSGALPWVSVNHADAVAACAAAGKRLCSESEWQRACQGPAATACGWSFATACTVANATTCNVYEFDSDDVAPGSQHRALKTESMAMCLTDWVDAGKIFDLTGNVREWTQPRSAGRNPLRGGSFDTVLDGSSCGFAFLSVDDTFQFTNSGFRCCKDSAP